MSSHKVSLLATAFASVYCFVSSPLLGNETSSIGVGVQEQPVQAAARPEVDFGEEGDVILQVFLRDILLTDAMFAIMRNGRLFLPLGELAGYLDFPIIVDSVKGRATGWYLRPENTFELSTADATIQINGEQNQVDQATIFADELDLFVDSVYLQQWLPLMLDLSLSAQTLTVRSSEALPKELARQRAARVAQREITFAATKQYYIPSYRLIDWPELAVSVGGSYGNESDNARYDYRIRALGDLAYMSGNISFSGTQDDLTGATVTLGRKNPNGMVGPLQIADFEIGDTSQFLPGLIGSSLSGRGLRVSNRRLQNRRDLDTIDLQGEQQADYEVELYVNDRLRGVDRDSDDNRYDFQDVPLQFGQNEIRLEFYGPQGQRFTESRRSFVGTNNGRRGQLTYEFALLEPGKRIFDLIDELDSAPENKDLSPLKLSSALNLSYGLTRRSTLGLTLATVAAESTPDPAAIQNPEPGLQANGLSTNRFYANVNLTSDIAGNLIAGDLTIDSEGKAAGAISARTSIGNHELSLIQRAYQKDFQASDQVGTNIDIAATKTDTRVGLSRQYFSALAGRVSYGINGSYRVDHNDNERVGAGTRVDYQNSFAGLSWAHEYGKNLADESGNSNGQIGMRLRPRSATLWSANSSLDYSDAGQQLLKTGSVRLARPLAGNSNISFSATRDLLESETNYSAAWYRQFNRFRFNTSVTGRSSDDLTVRFGLDFVARRYPGRWLPTVSSAGGRASVAVRVFADDNSNGDYDLDEPLIEGIRLTKNGLPIGTTTNQNGVAIMAGLSSTNSVDVGLVASDINDPSLKYRGIAKGVLPRPGRVPVVNVPLERATDLEGTVTVAGTNPAPNVRMVLTPVDGGELLEISTEYDGYYYLAHVPLDVYDFGPDPQQIEAAGLIAEPSTIRLDLRDLTDFPPPVDFELIRLTDRDVDNDGVPDVADAFPQDPTESVDTDNDGIGNNADLDDDGDSVADAADAFPLDETETMDTDADGTGNNRDSDDDGDGVEDSRDAFPLDALESLDTDNDGIGNNRDRDDDGDKVKDRYDLFPLDATESSDSDLDGIGDNKDPDDDNDSIADIIDLCPTTSIPELTVPKTSLRRGRYALTEATREGQFNSTNRRTYTLQQTRGCSCEQILMAKAGGEGSFIDRAKDSLQEAVESLTPSLAAALDGILAGEIVEGCRGSTLKSWSKRAGGQ